MEKIEKKDKEYFATLISPEVPKPPIAPLPAPNLKPLPPAQRHTNYFPPIAKNPAQRSLPRPSPLESQPVPNQENPMTMGEGTGKGNLTPDKIDSLLKPGETGKAGEVFPKKESLKPGFSERGKFLFDQDVTEQIAGRSLAKANKEGDRNHPITFDTKVYEYSGYMTKLKQKIESIWQFPPDAVSHGIKFPQDLKIQFTIKRDGKLAEVRLIRTSGYKILDDAALKALRDGEPYWPLPEEWGKDSYTILGHFIYGIYGYELR